uniref:Amino acid transporter n=1 Tax=Xiphophorus couchianus TaxID=32473 RepID=A0A3B5KYE9_9TELE
MCSYNIVVRGLEPPCVCCFFVVFFAQNGTETKLIGKYVDGPNMLGLVIWSFVIGIMINRIGKEARSTVDAIQCLNDAIKVIVNWILWYLPVGVMFLLTEHVLGVGDWDAVLKLAKFVGVVLAGLAVQAFIVFPMIYVVLTRRNPFLIFKQTSRALTTAFIIASSAATLPLTLQCCEENVKVDKKLCRLMLPIVTSINRTGLAFYEVSATIFIAQLHDITLGVGQIIAIGLCLVCSLSSSIITFGTAGIPATGAVTTILILTAVGLPAEHAAILIGTRGTLVPVCLERYLPCFPFYLLALKGLVPSRTSKWTYPFSILMKSSFPPPLHPTQDPFHLREGIISEP